MVKLVLFDIDGTILTVHGVGSRSLISALEKVFGQEILLNDYSMSGKTDTQIVLELMARVGIGTTEVFLKIERVWEYYLQGLEQTLEVIEPRVFPGIPSLVLRLSQHPQVVLGLLTGNVEQAAWIKLRSVGLDPYFCLGAFGDQAARRDLLPEKAVAKAKMQLGKEFQGKDIVIIGDTPNDIHCGRHLGVKSIAVATGKFSLAQLSLYDPDALFEDLEDMEQVCKEILI